MLLYAVREIAVRSPLSPSSNVVINLVTPGLCKSDLQRDDISSFPQLVVAVVLGALQRSTEVGARILVDAVRPDIDTNMHGAFLMDLAIAE